MNVSDIMTEKPVTIRPSNTLREALEAMDRVGCHHLPVVSADSHVVGILTERDCRTALNAPHIGRERWQDEALADYLQVRSIMTSAPIIVEPSASADEAARLMLVNHISCLPVMRGETLIGIITTSDILMAFMAMHKREGNGHVGTRRPDPSPGRQ